MSKLEALIDRRYEIAKQKYPNITRDQIAELVYSLSEMARGVFDSAEVIEEKILETENA